MDNNEIIRKLCETENGEKTAILVDRIVNDFALHPPSSDQIGKALDLLRAEFMALAVRVTVLCPGGRELSMAITDLDNGLIHAIAAIARHQEDATAWSIPEFERVFGVLDITA